MLSFLASVTCAVSMWQQGSQATRRIARDVLPGLDMRVHMQFSVSRSSTSVAILRSSVGVVCCWTQSTDFRCQNGGGIAFLQLLLSPSSTGPVTAGQQAAHHRISPKMSAPASPILRLIAWSVHFVCRVRDARERARRDESDSGDGSGNVSGAGLDPTLSGHSSRRVRGL